MLALNDQGSWASAWFMLAIENVRSALAVATVRMDCAFMLLPLLESRARIADVIAATLMSRWSGLGMLLTQ
jgi:hypothetical protein